MKETGKYLEKNVVVGSFQCNCRILVCPITGKTALIDPGDEPAKIIRALEGVKTAAGMPISVEYLLHTHAHLDHIGGTRGVVEGLSSSSAGSSIGADDRRFTAEIAVHRADEPMYQALQQQGLLFGMSYDEPLPITHYLEHEEKIEVGELRFSVIHTPGHSPGSVGFRLHEDTKLGVPETLYSGDTLFQGSVGRTDLWGADGDLMFKMIRERLLTLDGDTRVCPGHGGESRIGIEKTTNPFLVG